MNLFKIHQKPSATAFRVALLLSVLLNGILLFLAGGIYTPAGQISSVSRTISLVNLIQPPEQPPVPEPAPEPLVEPEPQVEPVPQVVELEPKLEPEPEPERQVEVEKVPEPLVTEQQHDPEHNPDGNEVPSGTDERGPDKPPQAIAPSAEKPMAKAMSERREMPATEKSLAATAKALSESAKVLSESAETLPETKKPAPLEMPPILERPGLTEQLSAAEELPGSVESMSSNALISASDGVTEVSPEPASQPPELSEKDRLWLETSQLAMLADTDLQGVNASHEDYFKNASRQKFINYYLAEMERQIMAVWPAKRWPGGLSGSIRFELDPQGYLLAAVVHLPTAMPEFDRAILRAVQAVQRYRVPSDPSIAARYYSTLRFDYSSTQTTTETAPWETGASQRLHMSR